MNEADDTAIAGLKETVDCSFWAEEVSDMFRKVHDDVKASFRVGKASIPDESKDWKDYSPEGFQENIGVMNFLWNTKKRNPKGVRN